MLMEVKNQFKITLLSVKYALVREMLNKTTFITNILFMILNNASFIIQWIVLYSLKDNIGGYTFNQVLLLWGIAASTYGFSHFFFKNAYYLSDTINNGKLDSFLVQPKNVLLSAITNSVETSAIGDFIYGYIMLFIFGFSIKNFILFTFFTICGGFILTSISVILSSLSFWFNKSDIIVDTGNSLMTSLATYPDGIFKGIVKILIYTLIPAGIVNYIPVEIMTEFNINLFLIVIIFTITLISLAFLIFYKGLKRYSSSNLMVARI
ncbi:MAG: ABC-2 family transporter protein [Bacilli bacterium]|nr:ABC-2 family transporter protein [Bacilli bacterium]